MDPSPTVLGGVLRWGIVGVLLGAAVSLIFLYGFPEPVHQDLSLRPTDAEKAAAAQKGAPAPAFDLMDVHGEKVELADFHGEVVLINFWATWCGPCRLEMPVLQDYYERYRSDGFQVLAVNYAEPRDEVESFAAELDLSFPLLLDPGGAIQRRYGVRGYPSSYVVDRRGIIRMVHIGILTEGQLDGYLEELGLGS